MDYFSGRRARASSNASSDRASIPGQRQAGEPSSAAAAGPAPAQLAPPAQQSPVQQRHQIPRRPLPSSAPSYESLRAPASIRIRRLPSGNVSQINRPTTQSGAVAAATAAAAAHAPDADTAITGRRRSSSAPQRPFGYGQSGSSASHQNDLARQQTLDGTHMPAITETDQITPQGFGADTLHHMGLDRSNPPSIHIADHSRPNSRPHSRSNARPPVERILSGAPAMHSAGYAAQRNRPTRGRTNTLSSTYRNEHVTNDEYSSDVIDLLDLVDPEVRTIGTLTNLQNSLFVPDLGSLINRRPTYDLSRRPTGVDFEAQAEERRTRSRAGTRASRINQPAPALPTIVQDPVEAQETPIGDDEPQDPRRRTFSISSELSDSRYAVLPTGVSLDGWSDEEIEELNDHVRHLMHSRKEGFKRSWAGFKKYCSRPLGLFVVVYATLVTLFGAAWVFCLIGWIYVGSKQDYFINVIDNVLVALFALLGDGLAPFRAVDTYHMCFIAHYHHLTWRLRREKKLPELVDENDLPDRRSVTDHQPRDDEIDEEATAEFSVLSPRQQKRLQYHQAKFNKSHTFYKPHETATHHAFPLRLLVAIVVLLDCHSLFQVALGTCTWSIDYRVRPEALTSTILACSISCNIAAGVVISIGDHKTRKKDVLERIFRQGLTEEAMRRMAMKRNRGELNVAVKHNDLESDDLKANMQELKKADAGPSDSTPPAVNYDNDKKTAHDAFHTPPEVPN